MIESLYGTGSPMWMALPSAGLAFQAPSLIGSRPFGTPMFAASPSSPANVGLPSTVQAASVPSSGGAPAPAYGYNAGMMPMAAPTYGASGFTPGSPFGAVPAATMLGPEAMVGVTAPDLVAAVAIRRNQPQGPTNNQEIEDFIYDTLELLPGAADVDVKCEGGRTTLTGSVQHKRVKRDIGEIAWAVPAINDVQNNVTIASRRRARAANREAEGAPGAPPRKQA